MKIILFCHPVSQQAVSVMAILIAFLLQI